MDREPERRTRAELSARRSCEGLEDFERRRTSGHGRGRRSLRDHGRPEPGTETPVSRIGLYLPRGASGCKHAVAVVAEYLQALADQQVVPVATEDDPRWAKLNSDRAQDDDDWDEDEDEASWDDDDEETQPVSQARKPRTPSRPRAGAVNWDDKIEQHVREKSQGELADLVWSLVRRFPEIYQEFRERIALQEGDVGRLVAEARREIREVTSETAWQNEWTGEGHIPDYSKIRHRFERLLELGHADEVVSLGREFLVKGMSQISEAHDEGDTAEAFAEGLTVVFQAVINSSLSGPERLLFAIDAELADDYDALGDSTRAVRRPRQARGLVGGGRRPDPAVEDRLRPRKAGSGRLLP